MDVYLPATLTEEIKRVQNHVGDLRGETKEAEEVVSVRPRVYTRAVPQLVVRKILKTKIETLTSWSHVWRMKRNSRNLVLYAPLFFIIKINLD